MVRCQECGKEVEEGSGNLYLCLKCRQNVGDYSRKTPRSTVSWWKKKKVRFFFISLLFLGICVVTLLTPTYLIYINQKKQWYKVYGGEGMDVCRSLIQTIDGGFALAGTTNSSGAGMSDMWLVKTDIKGIEQWNKTYGGERTDVCRSLLQTPNGGYVLAGTTNSFGAGTSDIWLVKTDVNGVEQWNETYGGEGTDVCLSFLQTMDGGYALAGYTNSSGVNVSDVWLVKTDVNGVEQWNETYGGEGTDVCLSLLQTMDGGYALAGYSNSFGAGTSDVWLVKTDINGIMQWNRTYEGIGEWGVSALQTMNGDYVLMCHNMTEVEFYGLFNFTLNLPCIKLIKIDVNGILQWNQTYFISYPYYIHGTPLIQTMDGGLAFSGVGFIKNFDSVRTVLFKTDVDGNNPWFKTYREYKEGETEFCLVSSILQTIDGDIILAGSVLTTSDDGSSQSISDIWLGIVILTVNQISGTNILPFLIAICVITRYNRKKYS